MWYEFKAGFELWGFFLDFLSSCILFAACIIHGWNLVLVGCVGLSVETLLCIGKSLKFETGVQLPQIVLLNFRQTFLLSFRVLKCFDLSHCLLNKNTQ